MADSPETTTADTTSEASTQRRRPLPQAEGFLWFTEGFKRVAAGILMVLMMIIVTAAMFELVVAMASAIVPDDVINTVDAFLSVDKILSVLGVFLTVLIALELIETVEVYFKDHAIHVEIVVAVAIIAMARKFILLDPHEYNGFVIIALGFVALALGVVYWLVRKAGRAE